MDFADLFEYDLWANRLWLTHLQSVGSPATEMAIFKHILGAQQAWLKRCEGNQLSAMPDVPLTEAEMRSLCDSWKAVAAGEDRLIRYNRFNGEAYENQMGDIIRHVLNHGTYHRGELRGMARARGDESFPETDYMGFKR